MRVHESMSQLRELCQDHWRISTEHLSAWQRFVSGISIYFTRVFLEIHMSANQATGIGLLCVLAGGALLIMPQPLYWFIGIFLIAGWELFDYVDGQIARYNKTASLKGALWAGICHHIIDPYLMICLTIGCYRALGNFLPVISGLMALLGHSLTISNQLLPVIIIADRRMSLDELRAKSEKGRTGRENPLIRWGRELFRFEGMIVFLLVTTAVDTFVPPFVIAGLTFNARYAYFLLYGLALFVNSIRRIYISLRGELRLEV